MSGNLKFFAFICMIILSMASIAQVSTLGLELQRKIDNRPEDPNDFLRVLERFSAYLPVMKSQEQCSYIETISLVYGCELRDPKQAFEKIQWFRNTFIKGKKQKEVGVFCDILLGKIHLCSGNNAAYAVKSFERALPEINNENTINGTNRETVELYCKSLINAENYYSALKFLQRILHEVHDEKTKKREAEILRNIAMAFDKLAKPDSCIYYLNRSLSKSLNANDNYNSCQSAFELGIFCKKNGKINDALIHLIQAFRKIDHLDNHAQRLTLCKSLGNLYIEEGNSEKALFFKDLEFKYADSIKREEKIKSDDIHAYELNRKRKHQLEAQNAFNEVSNQMKWAVFLGLSMLIFLAWITSRLKRKSPKPNESSIELNELVEKLKRTELESPDEKEKIIEELISDFKTKFSFQKWEDFERSFHSEHPQFLIKLNEAYPKLSSNEQKLCMCLSQNLTTKEISPLTGQNAHAINIARGRLRKKLGIDHKVMPIPEFLSHFF
jgi:hypothetical protein